MSESFDALLDELCSASPRTREMAAEKIFREGQISAERATLEWLKDAEVAFLLGDKPEVTVGVAVQPETFAKIRKTNGMPRLAEVPPDQDAEEFELRFATQISLDILTSKAPRGNGAIARYLEKFGEGVQQVEFRCKNVGRATEILKEKFGLSPVYPATRGGADGTRVNFFLVGSPGAGKVLIELYEPPGQDMRQTL